MTRIIYDYICVRTDGVYYLHKNIWEGKTKTCGNHVFSKPLRIAFDIHVLLWHIYPYEQCLVHYVQSAEPFLCAFDINWQVCGACMFNILFPSFLG